MKKQKKGSFSVWMKNAIFLILFFLFCISLIALQTLEKKLWVDGYKWEEVDDQLWRLGYLEGLGHGNILTMSELVTYVRESGLLTEDQIQTMVSSYGDRSDIYLVGATYGQVMDGVNELYKDYANKKIPVHCLATIVCKRVRGELDIEDMERELQRLRKRY